MVLGLAACGSTGTETDVSQSTQPNSETETSVQEEGTSETDVTQSDNTGQAENTDTNETKILVAYFSRTGENYGVGYIEKGNTHIIADMIAEQTGGDTFEIRTVTPYPDEYDECTEAAKQEQDENARPELAESVEGMEDYDVIFLGFSNWWGDMPMAVYTFLESCDFSGKTIVPFCTHEGSGLSSTESSIADSCPNAEVLDGLAIRGSVAQNSQDEAAESVAEWLRQAGFIQ
ncbi:MAG: flavodoxin [Lachnospiraceae bacterium]|nr:flavodoxin [Lachnospiraceae bacterium]